MVVGHFWFVPANFGPYSALIHSGVPVQQAALGQDRLYAPTRPAAFWRPLASLNRRALRRSGWPVVISGSSADDFPGGEVCFLARTTTAVISLDPELDRADFRFWICAHFGLTSARVVVRHRTSSGTRPQPAPPKPWY